MGGGGRAAPLPVEAAGVRRAGVRRLRRRLGWRQAAGVPAVPASPAAAPARIEVRGPRPGGPERDNPGGSAAPPLPLPPTLTPELCVGKKKKKKCGFLETRVEGTWPLVKLGGKGAGGWPCPARERSSDAEATSSVRPSALRRQPCPGLNHKQKLWLL